MKTRWECKPEACIGLTTTADSLGYPADVECETALAQQPAIKAESSHSNVTGAAAAMAKGHQVCLTELPMLTSVGMLDCSDDR